MGEMKIDYWEIFNGKGSNFIKMRVKLNRNLQILGQKRKLDIRMEKLPHLSFF